MTTLFEVFNLPWLHTVGYTLLHSLWQSCAVLAMIFILLYLTPTKLSTMRYAIASVGLTVIPLLSLGTFLHLYSPASLLSFVPVAVSDRPQKIIADQTLAAMNHYLAGLDSFLHSNISIFLMIWIFGASIFCLRIITGLLYVGKIKDNSYVITNEWSQRVQHLADQLKIQRWVTLAESALIQAPIVIGYLKPMILIPVGMCSNLSTEQLETIFLHELMHIRRHDYLFNIIQSFIEAIFFFNPVVWIISGIIRREREHCCDDGVVDIHGNVRDYAFALASLEGVRLSKPGLSIPLAENKNQLLNRIKRLMEKSVKNYAGRERVLPALLLIIGLICASWISIKGVTSPQGATDASTQTVASDTTKKDKKQRKEKKGAEVRKETSTQEDKVSKLKTVDKLQDDHDTGIVPAAPNGFHFDMPPMPDLEAMIPPAPDINMVLGDFDFPAMGWRSEDGWEEFGKEFEEKFKSRFGDFYQANEEDIQRMIEETKEKVHSNLEEDWAEKMQEFARKQEEHARTYAEKWEGLQLKNSEEHMKRWKESQEKHLKEFEKNHQEFERKMKDFEENSKRFEVELKTELVKDGYLHQDEKLTNMHWNNGSIEINGKKIKPADEKKYNAIHEKFFELH